MVDVRFSGKLPDTAEVYEVSIVAGMPAATGASQGVSIPQGKKFIVDRKTEKASLGEVKKEKATKEPHLHFHLRTSSLRNLWIVRTYRIQGTLLSPRDNRCRFRTGTWSCRRDIIRDRLMEDKGQGHGGGPLEDPSGNENMDARLQTTYLLG